MRYLTICLLGFSFSAGALEVVTTTPDLAAIVREVGQTQVKVSAIAKGTQDPHQIEAKPSFMVKMRDADLVVAQGLELESAWLLPLIQGSRNPKIAIGGRGYYELGPELEPIDIPKGEDLSRAQGDVHPGGNPHFQLDPDRVGRAAVLIAKRMGELDSKGASAFLQNAEAFKARLAKKKSEWQERLKKTGIKEVVTHHKTLSYFLAAFSIAGRVQLEPKPGIPPTASHLLEVAREMKARNVKVILVENYFDRDAARKLQQTVPGVKVFAVPVAVGGETDVDTNEKLFEKLVTVLEEAAH